MKNRRKGVSSRLERTIVHFGESIIIFIFDMVQMHSLELIVELG